MPKSSMAIFGMGPVRGARRALPYLKARPELDRLFDALADVDRLRLLQQLSPVPSFAGQLAKTLGWTREEVSKQLNLLKREGLVESGRLGRRVEYGRTTPAFDAAHGWLANLGYLAKIGAGDPEVLSLERQAALAAAFRTAGRRHMLECMCRGGPIGQRAAAADCGLSQGLASRGLTQLLAVGVVTVRSPGPPRRYAASPEGLGTALRWLSDARVLAGEAQAYRRRLLDPRAAWRSRKAEA